MGSSKNSRLLSFATYWCALLVIAPALHAEAPPPDASGKAGACFECQIDPTADSNFTLALFRIWLPSSKGPVKGVLAVLPGSESHGTPLADDPHWQAVAEKWGYALLAITYTTRSAAVPYYRAEAGSGEALLAALKQLAEHSGHPELTDTPIAILGYSQGGQFACHLACWRPLRVVVFAAIKGGYYDVKPDRLARNVPGLILAGALDMEFRRKNLRALFDANPWPSSKWAYGLEPKASHELGRCLDLIVPFFDAVITNQLQPCVGMIDNLQIDPVRPDLEGPRAWFPNKEVATIWRSLMEGTLADAGRDLSIPSQSPPELAALSPASYDFGRINTDDQASAVKFRILHLVDAPAWTSIRAFSLRQRTAVTVEQAGEDSTLSAKPLPSRLPLGPMSDVVEVRFLRAGEAVLGGAQIALTFQHTHPDIKVTPSSIYVGTHSALCESSVRISVSSGKRLAIQSVSLATGVEASIVIAEQSDESARLQCTFHPLPGSGNHSGKFSIRLSEPIQGEIIIPFIGFYRLPETPTNTAPEMPK